VWRVLVLLGTTCIAGCYLAHERSRLGDVSDASLAADASRELDASRGDDVSGACQPRMFPTCRADYVVVLADAQCRSDGTFECVALDVMGSGPDRADLSFCDGTEPVGTQVRVARCAPGSGGAFVRATLGTSAPDGPVGGYTGTDLGRCTCSGFTINFLRGESFVLDLTGGSEATDQFGLVGANVPYHLEICPTGRCR
jgi:hypothetical protein